MEPIKRDGTIREQISAEDRIRRDYAKKWGPLTRADVNEFYNPNYLCDAFRKRFKKDAEKWPYVYDDRGHGESRFFSKDMYNALVAKCRCGRPRTEGHIIKCLQKAKPDYGHFKHEHDNDDEVADQEKADNATAGDSKVSTATEKRKIATSSGVIGWRPHTYQPLDRSTYYVSPKFSIPGGRIDDKPYSNIFIG